MSSRLTKIECFVLIVKITTRVRQWATRTLSYAGRLTLINSILFGMVNYWAAIFLFPTEVIDKLTKSVVITFGVELLISKNPLTYPGNKLAYQKGREI